MKFIVKTRGTLPCLVLAAALTGCGSEEGKPEMPVPKRVDGAPKDKPGIVKDNGPPTDPSPKDKVETDKDKKNPLD